MNKSIGATNKYKTFLVWDSGLYSELACGLAKHGDKVLYYTPYASSFFPHYSDYAIGKGLEGIEKVHYFFDNIDKADCIVIFDVGFNDLVTFIKKHFPNKPCFGSGKGQKLEDSRWGLKRIIEKLGLPVQKSERLKGVHALADYLLENKDCFVKCDIFRGSISSFYSKNYKSVEQLIEYIEHELGAFSEDFYFVVEEAIHTSHEFGMDGFFDGENYVNPFIFGKELDKDCYIGKISETLPKALQETMDKLRPVLKELDWRGCISTEEKLVNKDKHYFLDICARSPNPLGLLYPEFIDNWPEMVYSIASKKPTKLETKVKYVGCVPLYSKHTKRSDVQVNFDPKYRKNIKFMTAYCKNGKYYAIKNSPEEVVAVVVAGDQTVDGLIKQLKKYTDEVDCYGIEKSAIGGLDQIAKIVKDASSVGIDF